METGNIVVPSSEVELEIWSRLRTLLPDRREALDDVVSRLAANASVQLREHADDGITLGDIEKVVDYVSQRLVMRSVTSLELCISMACNLRCTYCFVEDRIENRVMSAQTAREAVDMLFTITPRESERKFDVTFMGGEPLLQVNRMVDVVAYAKEKAQALGRDIAFNATTNCTLVDEKIVDAIGGTVLLLLSVDGDRETTDALRGKGVYDKIVRAVGIVRRRQPWIGARMTVDPKFVDKLFSNYLHLIELGFNQFLIGPALLGEIEWQEEDLATYRDQRILIAEHYLAHKDGRHKLRINDVNDCAVESPYWGCRAGATSLSVDLNGDVFPCLKFYGMNEFRLGHVSTLDRLAVARLSALECTLNTSTIRPKCAKCEEQSFCAGGCPATNAAWEGNPLIPHKQDCSLARVRKDIRIAVQNWRKEHEGREQEVTE